LGFALASGLGNVAQYSEVMQEPVNETAGGGFAVLGLGEQSGRKPVLRL
jgi:hypothetical protein